MLPTPIYLDCCQVLYGNQTYIKALELTTDAQ